MPADGDVVQKIIQKMLIWSKWRNKTGLEHMDVLCGMPQFPFLC